MKLSWKDGKYGAINGLSGDVPLFTITKGVTSRQRPEEEKYELHCSLPSYKSFFGYFADTGSAKLRAAQIMSAWIKKAGLTGVTE
jgi:hypothetical protein